MNMDMTVEAAAVEARGNWRKFSTGNVVMAQELADLGDHLIETSDAMRGYIGAVSTEPVHESGKATAQMLVLALNGCLHKPQDMTGGMSNDDSDGSEVEQRSCKEPGGKKEVDELGHPPDC